MVFILVDLVENFDKYIDKNANMLDIIKYYFYFLPWIYVVVSPIGLLLSANFTGNQMAKHSEVIACKAAGISSFRVGLPIYIFGIVWSMFILFFGEVAVPPATEISKEIKNVKLLKKKQSNRNINDVYLIGETGITYSIKSYNPRTRTGFDISIVTFDDSLRISRRIDVKRMIWKENHFILSDVYIRDFNQDLETTTQLDEMVLDTPEKPQDFERTKINPNEMGYFELRRYINKSIRNGRNPAREKTELAVKLTFPFSNFIILLFALPMALQMRKSGAALGFGISFMIAFFYFAFVRIGQSLGYNETVSPVLAANLGNILFGSIGFILLYINRD